MLERRKRIKRPFILKLVAGAYFLAPLVALVWERIQKGGYDGISSIFSLLNDYSAVQIVFLLAPWFAGVFLLITKRWAWFAYLLVSFFIVAFHLLNFLLNSSIYNFQAVLQSFLGTMAAIYITSPSIAAPYLRVFPRGWRGNLREEVKLMIKCGDYSCYTKDISPAGMYIPWKGKRLRINQTFNIEIKFKNNSLPVEGAVVRIDDQGIGVAFRNLTLEHKKLISSWIQARASHE